MLDGKVGVDEEEVSKRYFAVVTHSSCGYSAAGIITSSPLAQMVILEPGLPRPRFRPFDELPLLLFAARASQEVIWSALMAAVLLACWQRDEQNDHARSDWPELP